MHFGSLCLALSFCFSSQAKSQHWDFVRRLASELGIPVVVPHYTLLPLATGTQCTHAALDLCSRIMKDPRYKDKEIVVMGDSAGGWISMEVLIRLHQLSKSTSGQDTFGFNVEDGPQLIEKINQAILISAVVDFDWNQPEYDEAQRLVSIERD
jgi:surfactin synthase thioesterase subunit